jgi:hypothetical protein
MRLLGLPAELPRRNLFGATPTTSPLPDPATAVSRATAALPTATTAVPGSPPSAAALSAAATPLPVAAAVSAALLAALPMISLRQHRLGPGLLSAVILGLAACRGKPHSHAITFVQPQSALVEGRVRSRTSQAPVTLDFVNLTPKELHLFWLDFRGQRQPYGTIPANGHLNQSTFRSHFWLVANAKGRALTVVQPRGASSTVLIDPMAAPRSPIDSKNARSVRGAPTTLRFVNPTNQPLRLFWIDYDGHRRPRGEIAAHSELNQPTFAGHAWLVADKPGKALALFIARNQALTALVAPEAP